MGRVAARTLADLIEFDLEGRDAGGCAPGDAEGHAHGGGDADRGRAADDHGGDGVRYFLVTSGEDVGFLKGQAGLVEEAYAVLCPFECGNHA